MNHQDFRTVLDARITKINKVLGEKAKEYSRIDDHSYNFKRGAAALGVTPETYCKHLFTKHLISVFDAVDDCDAGLTPTEAYCDEKIGDAINYLILLEALFAERRATALVKKLNP